MRQNSKCPLSKLKPNELAKLKDIVRNMQNRKQLNLTTRDFDTLLRLLARGKELGPLFGQLMAILVQQFNLRHIPLRGMERLLELRARARALRKRIKLQKQQQQKLVAYQENNRRLSRSNRSIPFNEMNQSDFQLRLLAAISSSNDQFGHNRRNRRHILALLFASFNGPLLNSFTCILLSIGQNSAHRQHLLGSSSSPSSDSHQMSEDDLERTNRLQRDRDSIYLSRLERKFHKVRFITRFNLIFVILIKSSLQVSLSTIT